MFVLDCEVYPNYFLIGFKHLKTGKYYMFEKSSGAELPGLKLNKEAIELLMSKKTCGFNSLKFDLPILAKALNGANNKTLFNICQEIIEGKGYYFAARYYGLEIPPGWNHVDIVDVAPGMAGLKLYGARLHSGNLKDLPIEPGTTITPLLRKELQEYCKIDLDVTERLLRELHPQYKLRVAMSKQYKMDLRSKGDAQIAESVLVKEIGRKAKRNICKPRKVPEFARYRDPKIIEFYDKKLEQFKYDLINTRFEISAKGSILMPDWLKNADVRVNGTPYKVGIGGLHSCEKARLLKPREGEFLIDADVASYYPSIVLEQGIYPRHIGKEFSSVYEDIVKRRLKAKKDKDKTTADTLKIVVNASFGKLGNKYSYLYSPDLFLQVTITGQLALLMLIERIEGAGIEVVSANTDGVLCTGQYAQLPDLKEALWDWELDTSYALEQTMYRLFGQRDVNNYFALALDGSIKTKGVFAPPGLVKNPDGQIVYDAVIKHFSDGVLYTKTIQECRDICKFLTVRTVTGGAVYNGQLLGKNIRYYRVNHKVDSSVIDNAIRYCKNNNIVPKSENCKPLMVLPEQFPNDVNYNYYSKQARTLIDLIEGRPK